MRLIECYIENFGMLSGYSREFGDGVNTVYAENGAGKTTLSVFIKSMLYGMDDTRARSLDENDRKKYMPWQGGTFGGSLTFEFGGERYRVERTFGKKASDDTVKVVRVASGDRAPALEAKLGEKIFGIDKEGFEATVFLSERNIALSAENSSTVQQKLSDVVGADGATDAFDRAKKLLEEESRLLKNKRGGAGEIADTARKISECDDVLRQIDEKAEEAKNIEREIKALEASLADSLETRARLQRAIDEEREKETRAALAVQYKTFVNRENEARARLEELAVFFERGKKDTAALVEAMNAEAEARSIEEELKRESTGELGELRLYFEKNTSYAEIAGAESKLKDAERERAEHAALEAKLNYGIANLEKELGGEIPEESELTALLFKASKGASKWSCFSILSLIVGALMAAVGALLIGIKGFSPIYLIPVCIGVGFTVMGAIMLIRKNSGEYAAAMKRLGVGSTAELEALIERVARHRETVREDTERLALMENRISDIESEVEEYLASYRTEAETLTDRLREVRIKFDTYYELKAREAVTNKNTEMKELRLAYLREVVRGFLASYPTTTEDKFGEIREKMASYATIEERVRMVSDEREAFRVANKITDEELARVGEESRLEELRIKLDETDRAIKTVRESLAERSARLRDALELTERYDEVISARTMLTEKRDAFIKRYEVITKTTALLQEAADTMTERYIGKTRDRFAHYEELIGGTSGEFAIDTKFTITRHDRGETRAMESYSRGTKDLYTLALRLALVDSLYTDEIPPIILDDPFSAFDDVKLEGTKKAILEIGKERQIIYFTCSGERKI